MNGEIEIGNHHEGVTVWVPLQFCKRGGRKLIIGNLPASSDKPVARLDGHRTILKALGRAYRWKRMLESGEFSSITGLAAAERINHSYVRRIIRLTLLSPKSTEAILDGRYPEGLRLEDLLRPLPVNWKAQEASSLQ